MMYILNRRILIRMINSSCFLPKHLLLTYDVILNNFSKLLKLFVIVLLLISFNVVATYALDINIEGEHISPTDNNFTFAKSIWTNTKGDRQSFNGTNTKNYLLVDDVYTTGTFVITSPLAASDVSIKLYRLDSAGVPNFYNAVFVKQINGPQVVGMYYIDAPA